MKKIHMKEKGITIITLVITIIILLILAGISIATLVENDGLINKLKKAKGDYENAQEKELAMLDEYGNYIESGKIDDKDNEQNSSNTEIEKLQKEIETLKSEMKIMNENINKKQESLNVLTEVITEDGDYMNDNYKAKRIVVKYGNVITLNFNGLVAKTIDSRRCFCNDSRRISSTKPYIC